MTKKEDDSHHFTIRFDTDWRRNDRANRNITTPDHYLLEISKNGQSIDRNIASGRFRVIVVSCDGYFGSGSVGLD